VKGDGLKKVLLVDDDPDILEAMEMALEDSYDVFPARHGAEALRILEGTHADVIVLDLMMPVMNGSEFLRVLRARGDKTPVLVASAGSDLRARSAKMGANACLAKPFEISDLEAKLSQLLGSGGGAGGGSGRNPGGESPFGTGSRSAAPTASP
jgi:DNA-binding response OmpR family regulator